jgi:hypothetical protein
MVVAIVLGGGLVTFVYLKSRNMHRELLEEEAEGARERLMPTADGAGGYGT